MFTGGALRDLNRRTRDVVVSGAVVSFTNVHGTSPEAQLARHVADNWPVQPLVEQAVPSIQEVSP